MTKSIAIFAVASAAVIVIGFASMTGSAYADHDTAHTVENLKGGLGAAEQRIWDCEQGIGACAGRTGPAGPTGADGAPGADGTAGADGADGQSVTSTPLSVSDMDTNCPEGGSRFDVGTSTTYACNGADGADGATGPAGTDTLGTLSCSTDQIAKWDGSSLAWVCAEDLHGTGPKTVFVTSVRFTGDLMTEGGGLSGLHGGDKICDAAAAAADGIVPMGPYIAWLSNSNKDARDRLPPNTAGYYLPDGSTKVADSKTDLLDGSIINPIKQDETGHSYDDYWRYVRTGTDSSGQSTAYTCSDWTTNSTSFSGTSGSNWEITSQWTNLGDPWCESQMRLYCFQR